VSHEQHIVPTSATLFFNFGNATPGINISFPRRFNHQKAFNDRRNGDIIKISLSLALIHASAAKKQKIRRRSERERFYFIMATSLIESVSQRERKTRFN
jgi:hypothetical protein